MEPGTKALTDSDSEADATDGTIRGTWGEEASLGASGSSGAEWGGVERGGGLTLLNSIGQGTKAGTACSNFKLKRDRV